MEWNEIKKRKKKIRSFIIFMTQNITSLLRIPWISTETQPIDRPIDIPYSLAELKVTEQELRSNEITGIPVHGINTFPFPLPSPSTCGKPCSLRWRWLWEPSFAGFPNHSLSWYFFIPIFLFLYFFLLIPLRRISEHLFIGSNLPRKGIYEEI